MTTVKLRALTLGLLASTALVSPGFAQYAPPADATPENSDHPVAGAGKNATNVTDGTRREQTADDGQVPDETKISSDIWIAFSAKLNQ